MQACGLSFMKRKKKEGNFSELFLFYSSEDKKMGQIASQNVNNFTIFNGK